jgi:outer membrane protein assembly factor BamB
MLRSVSLDDGWNGWSFAFAGPVTGAPALIGSGPEASVIVAAQDGTVAALPTRPATAAAPSEPLWSYQTLGENPAGVATDGATAYVPSQDRALYALDASVGAVRWKWFSEQPLLRLPVIGPDAVYQPDATGVAAIDKATGELRYRVDEATAFLTRIGERDYFRLANGSVLGVDSRSGAELAYLSSPLFHFVAGAPTGSMLVFSDGSTVYALK